MLPNYYQVLEVDTNASEHDLRRAFRAKLKQLHPELNPSPNALEQFIMAHEAYEILIHANTRKLYDEDLRTGKNPANQAICAHFIDIAQRVGTNNFNMNFEQVSKTHFYRDTATMDRSIAWLLLLSGIIVIAGPLMMYEYMNQMKAQAVYIIFLFVGILLGLLLIVQGYMGVKSYAKIK